MAHAQKKLDAIDESSLKSKLSGSGDDELEGEGGNFFQMHNKVPIPRTNSGKALLQVDGYESESEDSAYTSSDDSVPALVQPPQIPDSSSSSEDEASVGVPELQLDPVSSAFIQGAILQTYTPDDGDTWVAGPTIYVDDLVMPVANAQEGGYESDSSNDTVPPLLPPRPYEDSSDEEETDSNNSNNNEQHSHLLFEVPTTEPTQQVHTTTKLVTEKSNRM